MTINSDELLIQENLKDLESIAILLLEIAQLSQEIVEDKFLLNGTLKLYYWKFNTELSRSSNGVVT